MGTKLLASGTRWRWRGASRAIAFLPLLVAAALAGCGGSATSTESEKAADAGLVDSLLAGELTLVESYGPALRLAQGAPLALAGRLRGQDQAHVDALVKVMRGLGAEAEAEAEPFEAEPPPRDQAAALLLAYEAENAALAEDLDAAPELETYAPRALAAALAANHAQHLVLLREALGAPAAALIPGAFESGDEPPPGEGR